ncbi:MAG: zinc ribbon domain-containing protein [Ilumatobacteraceae bacterium]
MVCPSCGAKVSVRQRFCNACGASLRGVTDPTEPLPPAAAASTPPTAFPIAEMSPPADGDITTEMFAPPTGPPITTLEMPAATAPALFDGLDDVQALPPSRERFRVRFIFVASFIGAIAALMAAVGDVLDIRTSRPTAGITSGIATLDDVASNLGPGGVIGAAVMVVGALLACFGLRWASGMAGGAGLALAGWAALTIGLVEVPVGEAESITRASDNTFTLTVTRDVGWWLVVAVGVIGVVVFLASLRLVRRANQRYLNPLIGGIGAVCMLVLAVGPLVPVGDATWRDNIRSPDAAIDLPTIFFAGRLAQVALVALTGVVGFLAVRAYGLGLAAGGLSVAGWLWITSLIELGPRPTGIAARNPGALDTTPHGVTTAGMALSVVMIVVAVIVALVTRFTTRAALDTGQHATGQHGAWG